MCHLTKMLKQYLGTDQTKSDYTKLVTVGKLKFPLWVY